MHMPIHGGRLDLADSLPLLDPRSNKAVEHVRLSGSELSHGTTSGSHPQHEVSARWSETTAEAKRLAPRLGEHSEEVLREAGFSTDEIAAMLREGVTKAPNL